MMVNVKLLDDGASAAPARCAVRMFCGATGVSIVGSVGYTGFARQSLNSGQKEHENGMSPHTISQLAERYRKALVQLLWPESTKHPHLQLDFLTPCPDPEYLGDVGVFRVKKVLGAGGAGTVLLALDLKRTAKSLSKS